MQITIIAGMSGRHAAVVYEAARLSGLEVAGFLTIESGDPPTVLDCRHLGGPEVLHNDGRFAGEAFVLAMGDNRVRGSLTERILNAGGHLHSVVHPAAIVSPSAHVADGTVVLAGAVIATSARVGRSTIVNHHASVDHDCVVEDVVNISPGARLAGAVHVGTGAFIGLNASVLQDLVIGKGAVVGAGAVVTRDVLANEMVAGVPARTLI